MADSLENLEARVAALEAWTQIPAQHIPAGVPPDPLADLKKVFPGGQPLAKGE